MLILGSTGSIGTQALEVIAANPDRFEVVGLAAGGGNPDLLAQQRAETGVTNVAVADAQAAAQVGDVTYSGPDAVTRLVENTESRDVVLNALVGALGLKPTLAALAGGARLALANKESLVAGGPLVLKAAEPGQIVPVDSEHSAMAQCLRGGTARRSREDRAHRVGRPVPAAGRPTDLDAVTPEQAGKHPTWSMGPMNTLNSAIAGQQGPRTHRDTSAVRHRLRPHRGGRPSAVDRSLDGHVHRRFDPGAGQPARYEAADRAGAGLAGPACRPRRRHATSARPRPGSSSRWTPRCSRAVDLARQAGQRGGCLTAVYNAANEEAAAAFLDGRIPFPAIVRTIAEVLRAADQWAAEPATVDDVLDAQRWARDRAKREVEREISRKGLLTK